MKASVNNILGCLPLVFCLLLLGGLGFCGDTCQRKVVGGIRELRGAFE